MIKPPEPVTYEALMRQAEASWQEAAREEAAGCPSRAWAHRQDASRARERASLLRPGEQAVAQARIHR
jgi:hypothetical protein